MDARIQNAMSSAAAMRTEEAYYAPVSRFGKLMDYMRRPEYLSASLAEFAMGESPYKSAGEAMWAGFSGKRRMDYLRLTGKYTDDPYTKAIVGFGLGSLLDPFVLLPFGAIPKIAKATKIPQLIGTISSAAGKKWPLLRKVGVTARWMFTDASARLKFISGWDEAHDVLRAAGISDDILKNVKNTGVIDDAVKAAIAGKGPQVHNAVNKLAEISSTLFKNAKVPARLEALKFMLMDEYADMTKWFVELESKHPEKAKAIIDLFEKNLPKVVVRKTRAAWGMSDEFMDALKKIGVTQDEIDDVLARVQPIWKGVDDEGVRMVENVSKSVKHMRDIPDPYKLPEFQELMDLAMTKMGPEAQELYKRAQYVQSLLVDTAIKRKLLDVNMLNQFAADLEISYLPHLSKRQNLKRFFNKWKGDNDIAVRDVLGLSRKYKGKILTPELIEELTKKGDYKTLLSRLEGVNPADLRKAGVTADDVKQLQNAIDKMTKLRTIEGGLNDIAKTVAEISEGKAKDIFEMNLPKIIFEHEMRLRSSFMYQSNIRGLLKSYEGTGLIKMADEVADAGAELSKGMVRVTDKMLGDYFVHKDLSKAFENCIKITTGRSDDFNKFIRMYDKGLGMWKYGTLIPFGKFHIRNLVSEMLLNNIAGMWMTDPAYVEAAKFLKAVKNGDKVARAKYLELIREGVIKTGFFASEVGASKKIIAPMWKRVTGLKKMEGLGEFTEDFPRIAMYFWGQKKGAGFVKKLGFDNVTEMVRKFHPVYDKFTPFERGFMRRVFPFYSWSRFNLPLHAEMFVQNPKHYARIERARHAITQLRGGQMPEDVDPEWIKEGYVIGWSKKPGKRTYMVLRGWLPHADLGELLAKRGLQDLVTRQLTPVKVVGEVAFGYDLFKKRGLPSYPGEKTVMLGAKVPSRWAHLASPIRAYQEVNRFFFGSEDTYWNRIWFHLIGRTYEIDVKKTTEQFKRQTGKAINELKYGISRAKQNGDLKTARTLEEQKRKLERAVKGL